MPPENWIACLAAASVMLLIPAPTVLPVIGQSSGGVLVGAGLDTATLRRAG